MTAPEQLARQKIDALLIVAGWAVQDFRQFNPSAVHGTSHERACATREGWILGVR